jgi:hypothetical protein
MFMIGIGNSPKAAHPPKEQVLRRLDEVVEPVVKTLDALTTVPEALKIVDPGAF